MPLISPSQQTDLALLNHTSAMLAHLQNAAILANRQTAALLALDDAALTGWLQTHAESLESLLTRHAVTGAAINAALEAAKETLEESGNSISLTLCDVRPLADKIAAQGRVLDLQSLQVTTPQQEEGNE